MIKNDYSLELKKQMIDFYLEPHMIKDVEAKFNITRKVFYRILKEFNVNTHPQSIKNELRKKSYLEHYGVEHPMLSTEVKDKIKQTNLQKYGCENVAQNIEIRKKVETTFINKYGVSNPNKNKEILNKRKLTCQNKYGVDSYFQTVEFHKKAKKHYLYDNEYFDSFPELCFYAYHKEHNYNIIRSPKKIAYTFNNKTYYYIPDFSVNDKLIEIKGDYFKDLILGWRDPYRKSEEAQLHAAARYKAAIDNKVIILYSKEYKKYVDWFKENIKLD